MGMLVGQQLSGGATIKSEFDAELRLARRWVETRDFAWGEGAEPPWLGDLPRGTVLAKSFSYELGDNPIAQSHSWSGTRFLRYDGLERLLAYEDENGLGEQFVHNATSNVHEVGADAPGRVYGPGNRLLQHGVSHYSYDVAGRIVGRREVTPAGERVWTYEWDASERLRRVTTPEGQLIDFVYDPFARRLAKHVSRRDELGEVVRIRSTRYVWNSQQLLQEIEAVEGGPTVTTTYLYDDQRLLPQAHRRQVSGSDELGQWLFYVGGQGETPEELISGRGEVLGRLERNAYGRVMSTAVAQASTQARFEGQFEDEETGLYYNRYRYYDPDTGRYLSHDPLGTAGGLNIYQYCPNPIGYVDPFGLHGLKVTLLESPGGKPVDIDGNPKTFVSGFYDKSQPGKKIYQDYVPEGTKDQWETHTERQAMGWAEEQGGSLKGKGLKMEGEYPPCVQCSKKMADWAKEKGCTIDYEYPNGRKVRYSPDKNKRSPQAMSDHPGVKSLCNNYQKSHQEQGHEKLQYQKPPAGAAYTPSKSTDPAWDSYRAEKANAAKDAEGK